MINLSQLVIKPKVKGSGIVRDAQGRPKVDDPSKLTPEILAAMTDEDLEYLGLKKENT